ncbi:MAG: phosphoribosylformylglycinamidine cyclo-ligase [Candidatus Margulisbacteria bacterium]|nr:phosphoribosylformylglycinamidine cyclo-ligase [Candidatus Margulisiibacteriota bacterium]
MITYKQAGVDVDAGNEVVKRIRKYAQGIGFFGGLYPFGKKQYLVGAADGVGTKVKIAIKMNKHDTIGIDLVAMNVNDIAATGAMPLFFLDYIGCHKVRPPQIEKIIKGVAAGCNKAGCRLLGGETAELSDLYQDGDYDLAGFAIGSLDKKKLVNGSKIKTGDAIIGLASSGLHSNGYSLARKVLFDQAHMDVNTFIEEIERPLGQELLTPTKIYSPIILKLIKKFKVKGVAHITGGGIPENLARVLPKTKQAVIDLNSWPVQYIFRLIQRLGKVDHDDMYRTFNMGLGLIVVVDKKQVNKILAFLKKQKEKAYLIGEVGKGRGEVIII